MSVITNIEDLVGKVGPITVAIEVNPSINATFLRRNDLDARGCTGHEWFQECDTVFVVDVFEIVAIGCGIATLVGVFAVSHALHGGIEGDHLGGMLLNLYQRGFLIVCQIDFNTVIKAPFHLAAQARVIFDD